MPMLLSQFGPPPKIIWITCGNTSNEAIKQIFSKNFQHIIQTLFVKNESFI